MTPTQAIEPETSEDPSKSRENSMQHGYTGAGIVLPDGMRRQVETYRVAYTDLYRPQNQDDRDLIQQAALGIVRAQSLQELAIQRAEFRAELAVGGWHLLRALDAQERAKRLRYQPQNVVTTLKATLGGVEWLYHEWDMLRIALATLGDWNAKQQEKAHDLMGVPRENRQSDPHRILSGSVEERKKLVKRQMEEIGKLLNDPEYARRDAIDRQRTIDGRAPHLDPILHRITLYERRAVRMYENARQTLQERLEIRESASEPTSPRGSLKRRINRRMAGRRHEGSGPISAHVSISVPPASVLVEPCGPPILPPFFRHFRSTADYLARITDPANVALQADWDVPMGDGLDWCLMRRWLAEHAPGLDLETAMRGLVGALIRMDDERMAAREALGETVPAIEPVPAPKAAAD